MSKDIKEGVEQQGQAELSPQGQAPLPGLPGQHHRGITAFPVETLGHHVLRYRSCPVLRYSDVYRICGMAGAHTCCKECKGGAFKVMRVEGRLCVQGCRQS